jgi:hypothetical protein
MNGQQKRARILIQSQQKQGVGKKEKGSYFPIQNLLNILSNKSSVDTSPVIDPK